LKDHEISSTTECTVDYAVIMAFEDLYSCLVANMLITVGWRVFNNIQPRNTEVHATQRPSLDEKRKFWFGPCFADRSNHSGKPDTVQPAKDSQL